MCHICTFPHIDLEMGSKPVLILQFCSWKMSHLLHSRSQSTHFFHYWKHSIWTFCIWLFMPLWTILDHTFWSLILLLCGPHPDLLPNLHGLSSLPPEIPNLLPLFSALLSLPNLPIKQCGTVWFTSISPSFPCLWWKEQWSFTSSLKQWRGWFLKTSASNCNSS